MATAELQKQDSRWPAGTTVKAYLESAFPPGWKASDGVPSAAAVIGSAAVAADGSLTIAGLVENTRYKLHSDTVDVWARHWVEPPIGRIPEFGSMEEGEIPVWDADAGSFVSTTVDRIGQALHLKLKAGYGGDILVLGDSTTDAVDEWASLMANWFASEYPLVKVDYKIWADGGSTWPAATTRQAGDGSHGTLTVWNCSVGGKAPQYFQAPYFDAMVAQVQADLTFINMGHNESSATAEPMFRDDWTALSESVTRAIPKTELVVVSQNPRTDGTAANQAARRHVTRYLANVRGYGYIDTFRVFLNADGSTKTDLLNVDGIHPTAAAEALMWDVIQQRLKFDPAATAKAQEPSSLLLTARNHIENGTFENFAQLILEGWTNVNCTLSKNVTNYESDNGYSVRAVAASAALAYLEYVITGAALKPLLGEWVTFAVRERVPSGANANVGRTQIFTTGAASNPSQISIATTQGQGGFRWVINSVRIPADAGTLKVRIFCENGTTGTGDISVDRCTLARGFLPRETTPMVRPIDLLNIDRAQPGCYGTPGNVPPNSTLTVAANLLYLSRFTVPRRMTIQSMSFGVSTAASVNDNCMVGIYAGDLSAPLAVSAVTAGKLNATGIKILALTSPVTLVPGTVYFAAFIGAVGGTAAVISGYGSGSSGYISMFQATEGAAISAPTVEIARAAPGSVSMPTPAGALTGVSPVAAVAVRTTT